MIKIFVFLGYGFGAARWRTRYTRGEIPGLNDSLPYGYHRAAGKGWSVEYSEDAEEGRIARLCRRGLTRALGFDLIHAWRHRRQFLAADVIWTHSERENLAVLALLWLFRQHQSPRVVAQCIWLFDRWSKFSAPRRAVYRWLLSKADVVTTHSSINLRFASRLLPSTRCELMLFGATSRDAMRPPRNSAINHPIRLASLGGDMHRDWGTLFSAFAGKEDFELRIGCAKARIRKNESVENIAVRPAQGESEVRALYSWADIVVLALKENGHVSGITVILESVASGIPVVATDTGGLRDYFSEKEICYVPPGNPVALHDAARRLAGDPERRVAMTSAAQGRLLTAGLTSEGYALRHRALSEMLLGEYPAEQMAIPATPTMEAIPKRVARAGS